MVVRGRRVSDLAGLGAAELGRTSASATITTASQYLPTTNEMCQVRLRTTTLANSNQDYDHKVVQRF